MKFLIQESIIFRREIGQSIHANVVHNHIMNNCSNKLDSSHNIESSEPFQTNFFALKIYRNPKNIILGMNTKYTQSFKFH